MEQTFPRDIDVIIGAVSLRAEGLLGIVTRLGISKSIDKAKTRGKKRVKRNRCDITLSNRDGKLVNMLRWGRKIEIRANYEGYGPLRIGQYQLENPRWVFPRQGVPHVLYRGLGGDGKTYKGKGTAIYKQLPISEVVHQIARRYGFQQDVVIPTDPKVTVYKPSGMTDHGLLDQLSYGTGSDWYVDDSTSPPTLVFRPPREVDLPVVRGQSLTIGWGPDSPAVLKAVELAVEHHYPVAALMEGRRTLAGTAGTTVPGAVDPRTGRQGATVQTLVGGERGGARRPAERDPMPMGQNPYHQSLARPAIIGMGAQATTQKILDCEFTPGIPFIDVNHVLPLVGMGDLSGRYRVVDVSHEIGQSGWTTKVKAILGGIAKGGKKAHLTEAGVTVPGAVDPRTGRQGATVKTIVTRQ